MQDRSLNSLARGLDVHLAPLPPVMAYFTHMADFVIGEMTGHDERHLSGASAAPPRPGD
jgi:hypothetical protein